MRSYKRLDGNPDIGYNKDMDITTGEYMSNPNVRLMTLHPDEHLHILIDRLREAQIKESLEDMENIIEEAEALRKYLTNVRLGRVA